MICNTCRRTLFLSIQASRTSRTSPLRSLATSSATSNAAPSSNLASIELPESSSLKPMPTQQPGDKGATKLKSSVAGGTELKGLAYLKAKTTIVAKEDGEYPEWLWTLLEDGKAGVTKVDLSAMTKKQRHKHDRKQERMMKNAPKPIPVHEQSKDLTGPEDDAAVSLERRQEITKSMRVARRKDIRESNFLKTM